MMRIKNTQQILLILFLIILTIPTFWRMFQFGIYTMHDFLHIFRAFEFHKCILDLQIPCRWAPDSAFEYGEPLFNFYGQLSYFLTEFVHLAGFSIINSVKAAFIFSLIASAAAMFFLGRKLWQSNLAGLISAILYVYAPYRAVDVWVRGALPEALAFVLYPVIFYFLTCFFETEKKHNLLLFSAAIAALIVLHNLSFLMFLLPLAVWVIYLFFKTKKFYLIKNLILAGLLSLLLSAFYLLPVVIESKLVTLGKTTQNYYDFRNHFANLTQLLISQKWGYGGSVPGFEDGLSFAAGYIHWTISVLLLALVLVFRKVRENLQLLVLVAVGWFSLFLIHQRSVLIWEIVTPIQFLQFPWRFLAISVFAFSLGAGSVILFLKNRLGQIFITIAIIFVAIFTNFSFFREDIWRSISDEGQFTGGLWEEQIASAVNDFWPIYGQRVPTEKPAEKVIFLEGGGEIIDFAKTSNKVKTIVRTETDSKIQLASVYFPGWIGFVNGKKVAVSASSEFGLSTLQVPAGENQILLKFENTPIRTAGNLLSFLGIIIFGLVWFKGFDVKKT